MTMRQRLAGIGFAICSMLPALTAEVRGQDAATADFYRGKTISLYIGYGPGGGYDLSARVLARHMGRHIPGEPMIVPRNMPGAGSLQLANYLYNVSPKDGTESASSAAPCRSIRCLAPKAQPSMRASSPGLAARRTRCRPVSPGIRRR